MTNEELTVFAALLDGVEGYLCETGYLRYWDMAAVEEARRIVDRATTGTDDSGGA